MRIRGRARAWCMLFDGLLGVRGSFFLRRESMPGKPGLLVLTARGFRRMREEMDEDKKGRTQD